MWILPTCVGIQIGKCVQVTPLEFVKIVLCISVCMKDNFHLSLMSNCIIKTAKSVEKDIISNAVILCFHKCVILLLPLVEVCLEVELNEFCFWCVLPEQLVHHECMFIFFIIGNSQIKSFDYQVGFLFSFSNDSSLTFRFSIVACKVLIRLIKDEKSFFSDNDGFMFKIRSRPRFRLRSKNSHTDLTL